MEISRWVLLPVFVLAVGCGAGGQAEQDGARDATTEPERRTLAETEPEAPGPDAGGFVATGGGSGGEQGAAGRIEAVSFRDRYGYERLLVGFGGRGGDGVPRWIAERPDNGAFVRLRFPDLGATEVSHDAFVGSVLDELYVVRGRQGGLFVDVFAMGAFRYRVREFPEAGRLAVDFRKADGGIEHPVRMSDSVVVLGPRDAEEVGSPLSVGGYARPGVEKVTAELRGRGNEVLAARTVPVDAAANAWGRYEAILGFSDYRGVATLRVVPRDRRGDALAGAETEVIVER